MLVKLLKSVLLRDGHYRKVIMPAFSRTSIERLNTCHSDIQRVFIEVVKHFDCTILYGRRSPEEQFELFKKGRKEINGIWVVEHPHLVVTYKDGYNKKSMHNHSPSLAVDVVPYYPDRPHIRWNDSERSYMFIGFVLGIAKQMDITLISGTDWDGDTEVHDQTFMDIPHFQLKK